MQVTWITQAGLLFDNGEIKIMVDPYFTDTVGDRCPEKKRRVEMDESFYDAKPDVIIITHAHEDHMNIETLSELFRRAEKPITVLCSEAAFYELEKLGSENNIVLLSPHTVWSEGNVTFYSVKAEHTCRTAIGVIIDDGDSTYYISGDTLYNYDVIDDVMDLCEGGVDYAFLPINGVGGNMNAKDAADFAYELGAGRAVPLHYGLFDGIDPATFDFEDALVLEPFVPVELE
ncbi:MAG: MBL fold metallo-hydrolase [Clostridia bacterium]|nr:MBL fold metallo-hydrolase [Clostridia bacterium]